MKETLLTGWTFVRWLRLIIGGYFVLNSIHEHNYGVIMVGSLFIFQALTNTGCMGGACGVPQNGKTNTNTDPDVVEFEEVTKE
ncbi:MAG: hypothetical protein U0V04_06890 [Spirosomataceae bacterium]|jgi:hypothetical protein